MNAPKVPPKIEQTVFKRPSDTHKANSHWHSNLSVSQDIAFRGFRVSETSHLDPQDQGWRLRAPGVERTTSRPGPGSSSPHSYPAQHLGRAGCTEGREGKVKPKGHRPRWLPKPPSPFLPSSFPSWLSNLRSQPSPPISPRLAEKLLTRRFRSILARLLPTNRGNWPPETRTPHTGTGTTFWPCASARNPNSSGRRRGRRSSTLESEREGGGRLCASASSLSGGIARELRLRRHRRLLRTEKQAVRS